MDTRPNRHGKRIKSKILGGISTFINNLCQWQHGQNYWEARLEDGDGIIMQKCELVSKREQDWRGFLFKHHQHSFLSYYNILFISNLLTFFTEETQGRMRWLGDDNRWLFKYIVHHQGVNDGAEFIIKVSWTWGWGLRGVQIRFQFKRYNRLQDDERLVHNKLIQLNE